MACISSQSFTSSNFASERPPQFHIQVVGAWENDVYCNCRSQLGARQVHWSVNSSPAVLSLTWLGQRNFNLRSLVGCIATHSFKIVLSVGPATIPRHSLVLGTFGPLSASFASPPCWQISAPIVCDCTMSAARHAASRHLYLPM